MLFCHEGVGQILTGLPPPGNFLLDTFPLLEVGVTLVGGGATASFLGALAATAVKAVRYNIRVTLKSKPLLADDCPALVLAILPRSDQNLPLCNT